MKATALAVFDCIVALVVTYELLAGKFDRTFWLNFVPGLLTNLVVLLVALFAVDFLVQQNRKRLLSGVNAPTAQVVRFCANRFAYRILERLQLADQNEISRDPEVDFRFAIERLRTADLQGAFLDGMTTADRPAAFVDELVSALSADSQALSKALDRVYPRADPSVTSLVDATATKLGTLGGFGSFLRAIEEAKRETPPEQALTEAQIGLIKRVALPMPLAALAELASAVVQISDRATANSLFVDVA